MGTPSGPNGLSSTLFGKTRRAVLSLLYGQTDEAFHQRRILRTAGTGHGAGQRELRLLSEAGIIRRFVRGKQVYYQANPACPVFAELKGIITKTAGTADVLRESLAPLANDIAVALVYGSVARGEERRGSDVDIMVIGGATFAEITEKLGPAHETLGREINPTMYPPDEFRNKVAQGHHFIAEVLGGAKIFLLGDERELARVAGKRLAGEASDQRTGNS
ncbi:MAG: nucleotidyltransferase domain-containing protein [Dehalococcoidia bacterium]|nr:nucleotidyltransferase domain-containing protein [Dehalococcoidia bacterium]